MNLLTGYAWRVLKDQAVRWLDLGGPALGGGKMVGGGGALRMQDDERRNTELTLPDLIQQTGVIGFEMIPSAQLAAEMDQIGQGVR